MKELFHQINLQRKTYFDSLLTKTGLTMIELELLSFLDECPDSNTFTEIQRSKDYAKSHLSSAIGHLVEKGYVERRGAENNKKVQFLFLTEKSVDIVEEYDRCATQFRRVAFDGITQEEKELFLTVLHKMRNNLKEN